MVPVLFVIVDAATMAITSRTCSFVNPAAINESSSCSLKCPRLSISPFASAESAANRLSLAGGAPDASALLAGSWKESSRYQSIHAEFSRTRTDQPHKKQHIKNFGKVKEIVHPIQWRQPLDVAGKLSGQNGDHHIAQQEETRQA